jgi:hypothetical protein
VFLRRNLVGRETAGPSLPFSPHPASVSETVTGSGTATPLRFGVNYTPRKRWWYCWLDWDQQAVEDDLSGIAALGLDHIRIQCLWQLFQPGISTVSNRLLANLHSLLDAADRAGLDVEVTVLNGWMSGLAYLPAWVMPLERPVNGDNRNIFTSPAVIDAEKLLFRRIAETIGGHKRFLGFDLGNELNVLVDMYSPCTSSQADAWGTNMLCYCESIAPGKFHVNGIDLSAWFGDFGFTRPTLATTGSATVVHSYIYFVGLIEGWYKYNDQAALRLADFMVEQAAAYSRDAGRKIWVEEIGIGGGTLEMPEAYKPVFMEHTVRNIAATGKAWGVTWWSSHGVDDAAVKDFDAGENGMGLLELNNKPRPIGKKLAELAAELRSHPGAVTPRPTALVIPDEGLSPKQWPPDGTYAKAYWSLTAKGIDPAIVLASRAQDEDYLRSRGIRDLIELSTVTSRQ